MKTSEQLLRTYVRQILQENDGGTYGDLASFDAGMNPYGVSFGSGSELYQIFVKPFVDVVDTAAGKGKELSQKGQTLIKVAFETIATSLIPILRDSYGEIFAKEKQNLDKIREEYKDVYQANIDAFRDHDVLWTAFCYAPVAVLTSTFVQKSPVNAIRLVSVLTGGSIDGWLDKLKKKFSLGTENPPKTGLEYDGKVTGYGGGGGGYDMGIGMEGLVREDDEKRPQKPTLASVLTNPKVLDKVKQGDVAQKLSQQTRAAVRSTLEQVYKHAAGVMKATSLQDLQQKTGAHLKGMDKLANVPQQERQQAEQAILQGAKSSMKVFYTKNLQGQVKQAISAGVPENSPYVQDLQKVASKIKAL